MKITRRILIASLVVGFICLVVAGGGKGGSKGGYSGKGGKGGKGGHSGKGGYGGKGGGGGGGGKDKGAWGKDKGGKGGWGKGRKRRSIDEDTLLSQQQTAESGRADRKSRQVSEHPNGNKIDNTQVNSRINGFDIANCNADEGNVKGGRDKLIKQN